MRIENDVRIWADPEWVIHLRFDIDPFILFGIVDFRDIV